MSNISNTSNNSTTKIPLKSRNEINFISNIKPQTLIPNKVSIFPFLRKFNNLKLTKKEIFELLKNELEDFNYKFCIDGSVKKNGLGGSSYISYDSPFENLYNYNMKIYPLNICILQLEL